MPAVYGPWFQGKDQFGPPVPKKPAPKPVRKAAPTPGPAPLSLAVPVEQSPLSLSIQQDPLVVSPRFDSMPLAIPPRGVAPGDVRINTRELDQGLSQGRSENRYMSGPEYDNLTQAALSTGPNQELVSGLQDQEQLRDNVVANLPRGQVDLSPLMAWADSLTGSKFAQSYKAPSSYEQRANFLAGMEDKLQSNRERLAQLLMEQTGGIKKGVEEQALKTGLKEGQKAGSQVPRPQRPGGAGNPSVNAARFMTTFDNSPVAKDASQALMAANSVRSHLQNPNWLGDAAARAGILQAMRLAPVSNLDVKQVTGSQDLFNQATQLMNRLQNGDIFTQNDRRTLERYVDYLQKKASMNLEGAADEYSRSHGPQYGYDYPTARSLLTPAIPKVQSPPQEEKKGPSLIQQLFQEELNK